MRMVVFRAWSVLALVVLAASSCNAGHVPVFGGPSYSAGTGYQFAALTAPPHHPNLVNNNGLAVGTADKYQSGVNQGRRTYQWSGSGVPFVEMAIPARFAGQSNIAWAYAINDSGLAIGAVYNNQFGERPVDPTIDPKPTVKKKKKPAKEKAPRTVERPRTGDEAA